MQRNQLPEHDSTVKTIKTGISSYQEKINQGNLGTEEKNKLEIALSTLARDEANLSLLWHAITHNTFMENNKLSRMFKTYVDSKEIKSEEKQNLENLLTNRHNKVQFPNYLSYSYLADDKTTFYLYKSSDAEPYTVKYYSEANKSFKEETLTPEQSRLIDDSRKKKISDEKLAYIIASQVKMPPECELKFYSVIKQVAEQKIKSFDQKIENSKVLKTEDEKKYGLGEEGENREHVYQRNLEKIKDLETSLAEITNIEKQYLELATNDQKQNQTETIAAKKISSQLKDDLQIIKDLNKALQPESMKKHKIKSSLALRSHVTKHELKDLEAKNKTLHQSADHWTTQYNNERANYQTLIAGYVNKLDDSMKKLAMVTNADLAKVHEDNQNKINKITESISDISAKKRTYEQLVGTHGDLSETLIESGKSLFDINFVKDINSEFEPLKSKNQYKIDDSHFENTTLKAFTERNSMIEELAKLNELSSQLAAVQAKCDTEKQVYDENLQTFQIKHDEEIKLQQKLDQEREEAKNRFDQYKKDAESLSTILNEIETNVAVIQDANKYKGYPNFPLESHLSLIRQSVTDIEAITGALTTAHATIENNNPQVVTIAHLNVIHNIIDTVALPLKSDASEAVENHNKMLKQTQASTIKSHLDVLGEAEKFLAQFKEKKQLQDKEYEDVYRKAFKSFEYEDKDDFFSKREAEINEIKSTLESNAKIISETNKPLPQFDFQSALSNIDFIADLKREIGLIETKAKKIQKEAVEENMKDKTGELQKLFKLSSKFREIEDNDEDARNTATIIEKMNRINLQDDKEIIRALNETENDKTLKSYNEDPLHYIKQFANHFIDAIHTNTTKLIEENRNHSIKIINDHIDKLDKTTDDLRKTEELFDKLNIKNYSIKNELAAEISSIKLKLANHDRWIDGEGCISDNNKGEMARLLEKSDVNSHIHYINTITNLVNNYSLANRDSSKREMITFYFDMINEKKAGNNNIEQLLYKKFDEIKHNHAYLARIKNELVTLNLPINTKYKPDMSSHEMILELEQAILNTYWGLSKQRSFLFGNNHVTNQLQNIINSSDWLDIPNKYNTGKIPTRVTGNAPDITMKDLKAYLSLPAYFQKLKSDLRPYQSKNKREVATATALIKKIAEQMDNVDILAPANEDKNQLELFKLNLMQQEIKNTINTYTNGSHKKSDFIDTLNKTHEYLETQKDKIKDKIEKLAMPAKKETKEEHPQHAISLQQKNK